ncbi:MAG: glutathione S-transferase family protein [Paracoccaceae bacterium]
MAEFHLYGYAESGPCYSCALLLSMARAEWAPRFVDGFAGETRSDAFLALNPMGEVPVLTHRGEHITQSGAILDYLSALFGICDPGRENGREALRWLLWDNHKLSGQLGVWRYLLNFAPADARDPAVIAFVEERARRALHVLDGHLADRRWIATDWLTTVDLSCAAYLFFDDEIPVDWGGLPNISAWKDRIRAEDGWATPYDLMPRNAGRAAEAIT